MRMVHAVFAVSAALFIFGIGFVVVGARNLRDAPAAVASAPGHPEVASTKQIMSAITRPTADAIFRSVQTNVSDKGVEEIQPRTPEEWDELGAQAAALAESGTLLMTGSRAVDQGDWIKMSQAMVDAARQTIKAVEAKKPESVLESGEAVNISCDSCHERYRRQ